MIGRLMMLVVGLWSTAVIGRAAAQEAAGAPERRAEVPAVAGPTDWQANGTQGAVSAGGRDAVAAGLEILKKGGNAADGGGRHDPGFERHGFAVVLFRWRSADPGLRCPATRGHRDRRAGGSASAGDARSFQGRRRHPGQRDRGGGRSGRARRLSDAARPLWHDDFHPGDRTHPGHSAPARHGRQPWHADFARTLDTLVEAEAQAIPASSAYGPGRPRAGCGWWPTRFIADRSLAGSMPGRRSHGGLIRYVDLATHTTRIEDAVAVTYHGLTIYKCGPWTQGPYLLEALQILKDIDLKALGHNRPDAIHTIVETMKLALADRDTFYADPLFADVPLAALLSPEYGALRRGLIDPSHASLERRPGDPLVTPGGSRPAADPAQRHILPPPSPAHDTTTCVVADRFGNVVAATPSGWSGVVAGDTGVWLGSRLQSFNVWEDHPNVIVPGKRPRITLSPTLVLRDNKPVLAISVAGGDNQDQMTLQLLLNHFDFGLDPAASVVAPRFMTDHLIGSFRQTPPALGKLRINPEIGSRKRSRR